MTAPAGSSNLGARTGGAQLEGISIMAEFTVNAQRFDPYKNFKFRVKWDGHYVAGISKISALQRTTEVVEHREGGDPRCGANRRPDQIRADHAGARRHP